MFLNKIEKHLFRYQKKQADKSIYGVGLDVFLYPESSVLFNLANCISNVYIARNSVTSISTGIAYGKNGDYIIDKCLYSYHKRDFFRPGTPKIKFEKVVSFVGPFLDNYYHFFECVLLNVPIVLNNFSDYKVVFPSYLDNGIFKEIISVIFSDVDYEFLSEAFEAETLIKITTVLDANSLGALKSCINIHDSEKVNNDKIFVVRKNALRRIFKNQDSFMSSLSYKGFKVVDPSSMSFMEQVAIFSEAKIVVGIHGAGLTNLAYSTKLERLYEIKDPRDKSFIFESLANLKHASYRCIYGDPISELEFYLDLDKFNNDIDLFLGDSR